MATGAAFARHRTYRRPALDFLERKTSMPARTLYQPPDRSEHGATAAPLLERARLASRTLVAPAFDSARPIWDRISPLLLLAIVSTLPLIAVTSGTGSLFGAWIAIAYVLAGYLWVDLAVDRADQSYQWRAFVVIAAGLGIVSVLLPSSAGSVLAIITGVGAAGAIVIGARIHTPAQPIPWYLLATALCLAEAGHLGAVIGDIRSGTIPAATGLVSLAGIALLPVALWLLLNRRVRGSSQVIMLDTAIVSSGLALLAWVFLVAPRVAEPAPATSDRAVALGWPLVGVAAAFVAVRFVLTRWTAQNVARQFAGAALLLLLAPIAASSWLDIGTTTPAEHPGMSVLWVLALIGFGVAALHPTMVELATPLHEQPTELDWQRGLLLTTALLLAPVALLAQHARGDRLTIEVLGGGTILLSLLFAARALILQRARLGTLAADRLLRLAASDLVVTHGRDAIIQTALDAARAIGDTSVTTSLYLTDGAPGEFVCLDETTSGVGRVVRDRDLPRTTRRVLAAGTSAWLSPDEIDEVRVTLGLDDDTAVVAIAPICGDPDLQGLLVSAGNRLTHDIARCQETLAALLALALDRQRLAGEPGCEPGRIAHRARATDGTAFTFVEVDPSDAIVQDADTDSGASTVADALREAIEKDRLIARYQPRLDLVQGRIAGIEITAAWESPLVGPVPRSALSAIAAEHGLSQQLRLALLVRACRQAVEWRNQHPNRAIDVVVPLSLAELETAGLAEDVGIALAETGCDPGKLVLQFTAATLVEVGKSGIADLSDITAIGVQLAVNESGASWAEIDSLGTLPISTIEIEAPLVNRIDSDERAAAIASHLIDYAHKQGAHVVAHGIDRREHWIALRKLNCDLGQGTLFSPPLDADELSALLSRSQQRGAAA
ncbi:MAG TPA: EAL domain-containing protein [Thermomicrobiales bacterium]|nr:EAL domain-containing protein [Thermomicrobiales bacterium]